jgi:hypothetical protein
MEARHAGGRDTHYHRSAAETSLEAGLHDVAGAVAALLAQARDIDPERDEFGHARSRAYTDAVALLKASAKVGHTIAELRGSKFEHSITVRRETAPAGAGRVIEVWETPSSEPEIKTYKGRPYNATFQHPDGTYFFPGGPGRLHIPVDWDEDRWRAGLPQQGEEGTPLPISGGSNGNSGNSAGAEKGEPVVIGPRIRTI